MLDLGENWNYILLQAESINMALALQLWTATNTMTNLTRLCNSELVWHFVHGRNKNYTLNPLDFETGNNTENKQFVKLHQQNSTSTNNL